jgi:hypothetical protein
MAVAIDASTAGLAQQRSDLDDIRNDILRCRAALAANLKQPASKAGSQKQRGRENRTRLQERKQLECTLDNLLAARSAKLGPVAGLEVLSLLPDDLAVKIMPVDEFVTLCHLLSVCHRLRNLAHAHSRPQMICMRPSHFSTLSIRPRSSAFQVRLQLAVKVLDLSSVQLLRLDVFAPFERYVRPNAADAEQVTDEVLGPLLLACPNLVTLVVPCCTSLQLDCLASTGWSGERLVDLDISFTNLSTTRLSRLPRCVPNLRRLSCYHPLAETPWYEAPQYDYLRLLRRFRHLECGIDGECAHNTGFRFLVCQHTDTHLHSTPGFQTSGRTEQRCAACQAASPVRSWSPSVAPNSWWCVGFDRGPICCWQDGSGPGGPKSDGEICLATWTGSIF